MSKFVLKKEFFGGLLADVIDYDISYLSNDKYEFIKKAVKKYDRLYEFDGKDRYLASPLLLAIYPSMNCNKSCSFCYSNPLKHLYPQQMSFSNFCDLVDQTYDAGIIDIEFLGGEPFTVPWIIEGIDYIISKKIHCSINTNSELLTEEMVKKLANFIGLTFRISIQDNYNFLDSHLKKVFQWCEQYNLHVELLSVMQKRCIDEFPNLLELIPMKIVDYITLLAMSPYKGHLIEYDAKWFYNKYNEILGKIENDMWRKKILCKGPFHHSLRQPKNEVEKVLGAKCLAATTRIEIMPNGDVIPCAKYFYEKQDVIGNIYEKSILDIWNDEKIDVFRKKIENATVYSNCKCNCKWEGSCSGCIGYAEGIGMTFDPQCYLTK